MIQGELDSIDRELGKDVTGNIVSWPWKKDILLIP